MNEIITTDNGTIIGEHLAKGLIDFYYECRIHGLDIEYFIEASVYRFPKLKNKDYVELDKFNKNHNTEKTYKDAILSTARRCDCIEKAKVHLKSKGVEA